MFTMLMLIVRLPFVERLFVSQWCRFVLDDWCVVDAHVSSVVDFDNSDATNLFFIWWFLCRIHGFSRLVGERMLNVDLLVLWRPKVFIVITLTRHKWCAWDVSIFISWWSTKVSNCNKMIFLVQSHSWAMQTGIYTKLACSVRSKQVGLLWSYVATRSMT